jgi:glycosyltransferase involved in cell wall biosynthesis
MIPPHWETLLREEQQRILATQEQLKKAREEKTRLQQQLQTARKKIQQFKSTLANLQERIKKLEAQVTWYRSSLRYRFGDALWTVLKPSRHTFRFPFTLYCLLREALLTIRKQRSRQIEVEKQPADLSVVTQLSTESSQSRDLLPALKDYVNQLGTIKSPYFVLMFSITTPTQDLWGNRPLHLVTALQEAGVPVLSSSWRNNRSELFPAFPHPLVFQASIDFLLPQIEWLLENIPSTKRRLLIASFPYPPLAPFINWANSLGWVTMYDAHEEWEELKKVGRAKWYDQSVEKYVLANCDFTTAVSPPLQDKLEKLLPNRKVRLSPNALAAKFLRLRQKIPKANWGEKTIIGYIGHLTPSWFDWESLKELARLEPAWEFELIGHRAPPNLQLPPNVKHVRAKTLREVVQFARGWSAAILPLPPGPFTNVADPIKTYEYLALGLPVVAFRSPQLQNYPSVRLGETVSEFRDQLKEAVAIPVDQVAIDQWLSHHQWSNRVQELLRWTDEMLTRRDPIKQLQAASRKLIQVQPTL